MNIDPDYFPPEGSKRLAVFVLTCVCLAPVVALVVLVKVFGG